jgi:hypothetical protein
MLSHVGINFFHSCTVWISCLFPMVLVKIIWLNRLKFYRAFPSISFSSKVFKRNTWKLESCILVSQTHTHTFCPPHGSRLKKSIPLACGQLFQISTQLYWTGNPLLLTLLPEILLTLCVVYGWTCCFLSSTRLTETTSPYTKSYLPLHIKSNIRRLLTLYSYVYL